MDGTEEDESRETFIGLVISCRNTPELFEIAEEILDEMSPAIHSEVAGNRLLAVRFWRNDGLRLPDAEPFAQTIVVEALVSQQRAHVDALDQVLCGDAVVPLTGKQNEAGKISERIDKGDDLCRQAAARASDSLMTRPPFASMPC